MKDILIKNANIVNENTQFHGDVLIRKGRIEKISKQPLEAPSAKEINAEALLLMPGIIDDQVHFREPGLTHKATIYSESRAAVAGGTTSFMEMPNTIPNAVTQALLEEKYVIAANSSLVNYSFFMGATNDNLAEVLRTDSRNVCGIKVFMGSSTGNMLVDQAETLEKIFSEAGMLIATHCEDEQMIRANLAKAIEKYGDNIPVEMHPIIRDAEACYSSSSKAVALAKKHNARLHILHISTAKELELFTNKIPLAEKRITAEVCVHHLYFDARDYKTLGNKIKCNPAIKDKSNKPELLKALLDDRLDIIATDHAPHTFEEKSTPYIKAPAGLPLVQHSLQLMLEFYKDGKISLEKIVEKMCHAPAICFGVEERGFLREGYFADIVLADLNQDQIVSKENIFYKCGWSPLEGKVFSSTIAHTFVNGHHVYERGKFNEEKKGERLKFKS